MNLHLVIGIWHGLVQAEGAFLSEDPANDFVKSVCKEYEIPIR